MNVFHSVYRRGNAFVASIFTFFKQLTTMTPSSLLTSESKRVRIDRGNDETLGMEERQMLGILEKYSKSEMRLFLLSLRGRKEGRRVGWL